VSRRTPFLILLVLALLAGALGVSGVFGPAPAPSPSLPPPIPVVDDPAAPAAGVAIYDPASNADPVDPLPPRLGPWMPAALEWGNAAYGSFPDVGKGLTVSGRIEDERGDPVPAGLIRGAFIRCRGGFGEYSGHGQVRDGRYVFEMQRLSGRTGWGDRPKLFDVRAKGYVPLRASGTPEVWSALERKESAAGHDLVLRRAATIEGIVHDPDGKPMKSSQVGFVTGPREADIDLGFYWLTKADGVYRFSEIDPGTKLWLTAIHPFSRYGGRVEPIPLEGRLRPGETLRLDLHLPPSTKCRIEMEFAGWRSGLRIRSEGNFSWSAIEKVWKTRERTGFHRFAVSDEADKEWRHRIEFRIPHGATTHRIVVTLPPPRE